MTSLPNLHQVTRRTSTHPLDRTCPACTIPEPSSLAWSELLLPSNSTLADADMLSSNTFPVGVGGTQDSKSYRGRNRRQAHVDHVVVRALNKVLYFRFCYDSTGEHESTSYDYRPTYKTSIKTALPVRTQAATSGIQSILTHLEFKRRWRWSNDMRYDLRAHQLIPMEKTTEYPDRWQQRLTIICFLSKHW